MSKHPECHNCPFHNTGSEECLQCQCKEEYSYPYGKYLMDGVQFQAPDTSGSEQVTNLPDEVEDKLRKFLFSLFDLSPNELLCIQAIMRGQSLSEFARDMEQMSKSNKSFSRFRAFQTRKALLTKLGGNDFKIALTTVGQRKELKEK